MISGSAFGSTMMMMMMMIMIMMMVIVVMIVMMMAYYDFCVFEEPRDEVFEETFPQSHWARVTKVLPHRRFFSAKHRKTAFL